ncbi:MAG: endonuclease/exonuclease/phosphatase family protein [Proteobacteria bacterium]|nr:endonuclease/exonuclease/phosphatase family protein [Pseudomonadota bacterium]
MRTEEQNTFQPRQRAHADGRVRHGCIFPLRAGSGSAVVSGFLALIAGACVSDGAAGLDALVEAQVEPAGANCASGGTAIVSGTDNNRNGQLDPEEVQSTRYVCAGADGSNGNDGDAGQDGSNALVRVADEPPGPNCPFGGIVVRAGIDQNGNGELELAEVTDIEYVCNSDSGGLNETVGFSLLARRADIGPAEIVAAAPDGQWLAYTVSDRGVVGFLDLSRPGSPSFLAEVDVANTVTNVGAGEPTSVGITPNGVYAVVAVKDTTDPIGNADPGSLVFIDAASLTIAGQVAVGVGPDSVKVTPDGVRVLVAIEDEEDDDLGHQAQSRPGSIQVATIDYANPSNSQVATVALTPDVGNNPTDPQPEFVDVSADSTTAIVSLQENNALAVLDLGGGQVAVTRYIDAGLVARDRVDVFDDEEIGLVPLAPGAFQGRREPDGVCFLSDGQHVVTANEGDTSFDDYGLGQYSGGRGFTIFNVDGEVVYETGDELERIAVQYGMYPDGRSDNRGIEVEGCAVARFGNRELAFLLGERNSAVAVYDVTQPERAQFIQFLPAPLRPESAVAVPDRGLLIVAGEGSGGTGGGIWIYQGVAFAQDVERYPEGLYRAVASGLPTVPFGSFSAVMPTGVPGRISAVPDDSFATLRLWTFEADRATQRMRLVDSMTLTEADGTTPLAGLDAQGLARNPWGGFALAVAGDRDNGCDGATCPEEDRNRILFFTEEGALDPGYGNGGRVDLPGDASTLWNRIRKDGFGGLALAEDNDHRLNAYVVFQRPLDATDPADPEDEVRLGHARIGEYDVASDQWSFYYYPLRGDREDVDDGDIVLADIAHVGGDEFVVIERDQQVGNLARVKNVFGFRLASGTADRVGDPLDKVARIDLLDLPFRFDFEQTDAICASGGNLWLANDNGGGKEANWFYELSDVDLPQLGQVRFATFNASMNRPAAGDLLAELVAGDSAQIGEVAAIIRLIEPDVLLLNEFDYNPADPTRGPQLFQDNYLANIQVAGQPFVEYPYVYVENVNTGLYSGFDLDNDGTADPGDPGDAFGFGEFHGQYGMVVFSRYPIDLANVRTFQNFLWKDMPGALLPDDDQTPEPDDYYSAAELDVVRLSSKSHWDLPIRVGSRVIHALVSHPTPPAFDGPEDRNGRRNHDEIRLWADYVTPGAADYLYDDSGVSGGLPEGASFVIMGDLNADPFDGDSTANAVDQLLDHPGILSESAPVSFGGIEKGRNDGLANLAHQGNPARDTSDFSDDPAPPFPGPGNLRVDYVLPSIDIDLVQSAVFWPGQGEPGFDLIDASDHRLIWVDLK